MTNILTEVTSALQQNQNLFIAVNAILGLLLGSFLNVVIHRLPTIMEQEWRQHCSEIQGQTQPLATRVSLLSPGSSCPHCGHKIRALENIPVLSYLFLRGKCSHCNSTISSRYPMVEILTSIIVALIAWKFGYSYTTLFGIAFACALISLTWIDFDTQLLPDSITLPLLWLGLIFNINYGFTDLKSAVIGAIAGYLILWSVFWLFKLIRGKEGMGYGDFKLLAAIGAWFGWQLLPAVILLSSALGAAIGITLILLSQRSKESPIPFGPFLAISGFAALLCGEQLTSFYPF